MSAERCDECGFDGEGWTDAGALTAIAELPARWADAARDLTTEDLRRRLDVERLRSAP